MTLKIGDHAQAADSLRQAHERAELFHAIIEGLGESVLVVDREGREVYSNRELRRFRGEVAPDQDINAWRSPQVMKIYDAERRELAPDQWPVARALRGDYADNFEIIVSGLAHRKGETVLSISTRSMINSAGEVVGAVIVTRDITDLRQTERELRQSQKLEAIGQLTGGVAHDFNNLLTVILGNADALIARLEDRPDLQRLAKTLAQAAERGAELTHHMLAFSRQQPIQPRNVDVGDLVQRMRDLLTRALAEEVELSFDLADDLWPARVDPSLLETSILNLCINARDAMARGGRLGIEVRNLEIAAGQAPAPGEYVVVSVSDTGSGIAPQDLSRIFEPFFTTKAVGKGTGLGLSMVYGFVKQSGGDVQVRSSQGVGTTVRMFLPRSRQAADATVAPAAPLENVGGTESILVVEDNDLVRAHAQEALTGLGYNVTLAHTAAEALAILRGPGAQFDLMFTDIVMPGGMNGRALAHAAKGVDVNLKILLTSGYAAEFGRSGDHAEDGFPLLAKPYSRLGLAQAVRAALTAPAAP